eukprot:GEMP01070509.1.p2 GENE.GEMP01070509.1~~GEMP01070509.1.p2  ORF type:complete len:139 (+),score=17.97 GEMP01070509.1:69-485(+)
MSFSQAALCRSAEMQMQLKMGGINRIILADGRPLFGDCGEAGSAIGRSAALRSAVVAAHAVPPRAYAYSDMESKPKAGPFPARSYVVTGPSPCQPAPRCAGPCSSFPAPLMTTTCPTRVPTTKVTQYKQYAMETGAGY